MRENIFYFNFFTLITKLPVKLGVPLDFPLTFFFLSTYQMLYVAVLLNDGYKYVVSFIFEHLFARWQCWLAGSPLWSRPKYLIKYWMDCHDNLNRNP